MLLHIIYYRIISSIYSIQTVFPGKKYCSYDNTARNIQNAKPEDMNDSGNLRSP
jgi:hypothetical protein